MFDSNFLYNIQYTIKHIQYTIYNKTYTIYNKTYNNTVHKLSKVESVYDKLLKIIKYFLYHNCLFLNIFSEYFVAYYYK